MKVNKKELGLWVFVLLSAVFFIGNVSLGGRYIRGIADIGFGLFGVMTYIFPLGFLVSGFFLVANNWKQPAVWKAGCGFGLYVSCCVVFELLIHGSDAIGPVRAFELGMGEKSGGGFFGGVFAAFFTRFLGLFGAYLITLSCLGICAIILSGKTIVYQILRQKRRAALHRRKREKEQKERRAAQEAENVVRAEKLEKKQRERQEREKRLKEIPENRQESRWEIRQEIKQETKQKKRKGLLKGGLFPNG